MRHDDYAMHKFENNQHHRLKWTAPRVPHRPAAHTHYAAWAERAGNVLNSTRARFLYSDGREREGVGGKKKSALTKTFTTACNVPMRKGGRTSIACCGVGITIVHRVCTRMLQSTQARFLSPIPPRPHFPNPRKPAVSADTRVAFCSLTQCDFYVILARA